MRELPRKLGLRCSGGLLDRLCEAETRREELDYAQRLIYKYGSVDEVLRQVELERIRPGGRLKVELGFQRKEEHFNDKMRKL